MWLLGSIQDVQDIQDVNIQDMNIQFLDEQKPCGARGHHTEQCGVLEPPHRGRKLDCMVRL